MAVIRGKSINFKSLTIDRLQDAGMTPKQAISYYNKVYQSALSEVGKHQKGTNVAREVYASLFYQGEQTFTLTDGQKLKLNPIVESASSVTTGITLNKMQGFFEKYGDSPFIQETFEKFRSGKMSIKEFNQTIKTYKTHNVKYLQSGS